MVTKSKPATKNSAKAPTTAYADKELDKIDALAAKSAADAKAKRDEKEAKAERLRRLMAWTGELVDRLGLPVRHVDTSDRQASYVLYFPMPVMFAQSFSAACLNEDTLMCGAIPQQMAMAMREFAELLTRKAVALEAIEQAIAAANDDPADKDQDEGE